MAPKLSKFCGSKRKEKMEILSSYMKARERSRFKKEALQAVANEYGFTFTKVQSLVQRYKPEEGAHLRLHRRNTLTFEQEARAVGLILGMANIDKPLDTKGFIGILEKLHEPEKLTFGRKWVSGFLSRWSNQVSRSNTLLVSAGRSNSDKVQSVKEFIEFLDGYEPRIGAPATAVFNVDESRVALAGRLVSKASRKSGTRGKREHQHGSIVPFVSAAGEVVSVFYVLGSKLGGKLVSVPHLKSLPERMPYPEYLLKTSTGHTNKEVFPAMMAKFEEDFHRLYPGVRALVYLDRSGSHTTSQLLAVTKCKLVSVVLFPAGTNQFLQPLDDAVFGLFKTKLRLHRDRLLTANPPLRSLTENTLLTAMMLATHESLAPASIKASFRKSGLHPWNPENILAAARATYPDFNYADQELPDATLQIIAAIQTQIARPQDNLSHLPANP
jgi:hypothetical protein